MLEHKQLMHIYQESKTGLQAKLEAGIKFKKSTSKSELELDFVPVNLHIQQMKVTAKETDYKGLFLPIIHSILPPSPVHLFSLPPLHRQGSVHGGDCRLSNGFQAKVQKWRVSEDAGVLTPC